ncbi:MAG: precorrin-3B C(17)-methyltransferase [Butyrivibrio sp.]|nr:precorrin-3B C(17)-methyltransferase [Butyrivibrio sp.]
MGKVYVVGIGPGDEQTMTLRAREVLETCDVIAGYQRYVDLVRERYPSKEFYTNGMRGELERCEACITMAQAGKNVALICSGDAGVYGMASPLLEAAFQAGFHEVEVIPGVTAATSGAALLGAPVGHDFCVISLSDLLTPWETIEKRLRCAAEGDLCIVIYNPASHGRHDHLRRACDILLTVLPPTVCCGLVRNIGREGSTDRICTLEELRDEPADMLTTIYIGNSQTRIVDGRMVTPRGYQNA